MAPWYRPAAVGRYRSAVSVVAFLLVALCVTTATFATWANSTLFDSATFSERAVSVLDSSTVRRELASKLTEELARAGNQQAVNFRPAFQFAVEVASDTDTFRAIFRNAIRKTHESLLEGRGSGAGIDLSDSLAIISSTVQLPGTAQVDDGGGGGGLNNSFDDITRRIGQLGVWGYEDTTALIFFVSLLLAIALTVAGILISLDRRQAVVRLGLALALAGFLVLAIRFGAELAVRRLVSDSDLAGAIGAAIERGHRRPPGARPVDPRVRRRHRGGGVGGGVHAQARLEPSAGVGGAAPAYCGRDGRAGRRAAPGRADAVLCAAVLDHRGHAPQPRSGSSTTAWSS